MSTIFPERIAVRAAEVVEAARRSGTKIAVVETVTGGLLAAALTAAPGASQVFERGFVLYHADAKSTGLATDPEIGARFGAVSTEVTRALAGGLADHSGADIGVAITGYAGPTGGNDRDPVGTVYFSEFDRSGSGGVTRQVFDGDREQVKLAAVDAALTILDRLIGRRA